MSILPIKPSLNFTQTMMMQDGGEVRYITAREKNRPCWFFVRLEASRYAEYKRSLSHPMTNLSDFGQILLSGWGECAPEFVQRYVQNKFA